MLAAVIAQATRRIHVGPAGILLNYYSPLKVAKDFRLLQALFPGRIDLGVCAGRVDEETARGLLDGAPLQDYGEKVRQLLTYLRGQKGHVTPRGVGAPQVWILGNGGPGSTHIAAEQGAAFSLALFLGCKDDPAPVEAYRARFQPSRALDRPRWNIAVAGVCAETEVEARRLAALQSNPFLVPSVIGDPEQCRDQLLALARRYETDEIIYLSLIGPAQPRLRSYQFLADALALQPLASAASI
jgi:luciferase family oxidoreductase group 1